MLRYIYGHDLHLYPKLRDAMFRDRAAQFRTRLGWPVEVDEEGFERDAYDALDPLYVIWQKPDGGHGGSMRLLPSTGRTMINDHFSALLGEGELRSPLIWECTRFCLTRDAGANVAAALMLGGGEILHRFGIAHFVGVFDARMVRIYRMIGACPEIIGTQGTGRDAISVGLWAFSPQAQARVTRRAGLSLAISDLWFRRSFNAPQQGLAKTA